ncbi:hypothetical protein F4825DRAFT_148872 [Nemania diffusa]|nr:hypothetical protein F4825DRAFT_148872 [Nemania diffusa]
MELGHISTETRIRELLRETSGFTLQANPIGIDCLDAAVKFFCQRQKQSFDPNWVTVLQGVDSAGSSTTSEMIATVAEHIGCEWRRRGTIRISGRQGLVTQLVESRCFEEAALTIHHNLACQVIFTVIGWISMLYSPIVSPKDASTLVIERDGPTSIDTTVQPVMNCQKSFLDILGTFGTILPRNGPMKEQNPKETGVLLMPKTFNAMILRQLGVTINWVTSMSAHLDFDSKRLKLSLFCLPSFCEIHQGGGTIYEQFFQSFHNPSTRPPQFSVSQMMQEILLSYRLLFQGNKHSRKLFRKSERARSRSVLPHGCVEDPLLLYLCGMGGPRGSKIPEVPVSVYSLDADFPVFSSRFSAIQAVILRHKPLGLWSVWNDKREFDSLYTFRALLIFGTLGVLLQILQTVLQAVQTYYTIKG